NQSGKICVQVIDKSSGKYRVVHTVGSSADPSQITSYVKFAKRWITDQQGSLEIDFSHTEEQVKKVFDSISAHNIVGYDLLLGRIFDEIGFNHVQDALFRELVSARVAFPKSKLKTREYLYRYKQIDYNEDQI